MEKIRRAICEACNIPISELGCFTLHDHDGQPAILLIHGLKHEGIYVEIPGQCPETSQFRKLHNATSTGIDTCCGQC